MNKPKLSFWQIWNLSFGFLGVQIGYSLQNSNTSSIFESLGADVSHLSYFWLAAPLAGMVVQPIIGLFSDGTWTRFGRRIPYILGGAVISTIALMLMPNCPRLLAFAPLAMGAFILLFMDLSFNVTMQPFRALVADMLDDSQKTRGYVVQTFLINLGAVVGAILPLLMTWMGVPDEAAPGSVRPTSPTPIISGRDPAAHGPRNGLPHARVSPEEFARYNDIRPEEETAPRPGFITLLRNVPQAMVRLGVTQFFSWAALFLMWTYLKPAITGVVTDHATGAVLSDGATQTWVGVLNGTYPISACIAALFLGRIAARWGNKTVYAACLLPGAAGFAGLPACCATSMPSCCRWSASASPGPASSPCPTPSFSRAVEARHMGVYMGIFNFTITIPQIVIGLTGGAIVKYCFDSNATWMLALAALFMLLAALSVAFVRDGSDTRQPNL